MRILQIVPATRQYIKGLVSTNYSVFTELEHFSHC